MKLSRLALLLPVLAALLAPISRADFETLPGDPAAAATHAKPLAPATATTVSLLTDAAAVAPGGRFRLALVITHAPHKHTYWSNPGDSGTVTEILWKSTGGASFGAPRHPAPVVLNAGGILSFVHEGRTTLVIDAVAPASAKPGDTLTLAGMANWLECDADSCLPGEAPVSVNIPVAAAFAPGPGAPAIAAAEALLPAPEPRAAMRVPGDAKSGPAIEIPAAALAGRDPARAVLFPAGYAGGESDAELNAFAAAKPEKRPDGALRFTHPKPGATLKPGAIDAVIGFGDGAPLAIRATGGSAAASTTVTGVTAPTVNAGDDKPTFALALLLAFGGGVVLNIMPCVFPVLGLKIYGFVHKSGGDSRVALRHGMAFAAGIVVSFWALAGALVAVRGVAAGWLGAAEGELGWGFLQQMPGFNVLIAGLFLVMALGMCGVFEFGTGVQNAAGGVREREGYFGSFLSGALATIIATPCSGPGMAPAISFALGASPAASFAVFTALALGLAAPFVIFSASPKLLALLPRPGAWMESFKQGMSFLLFGSFAYFVWVLSGQLEEQSMLLTLFAFTVVAFAAWIYGRWTAPERADAVRRRATVIAAALALGAFAFIFSRLPRQPGATATTAGEATIVWAPWSAEAQTAALAAGKTVYVDFTARWCLTCQGNKWVYHDDAVRKAFAARGVVALKADWSNRSKTIAAELARYDKVTIPFNVVLRRDAGPVELPAVLTPSAVVDAISAK